MTGGPREPGETPAEAHRETPGAAADDRKRRARRLYTRVIVVQAITLLALWLLQSTYGTT